MDAQLPLPAEGPPPEEELARRDELAERLRWLVKLRWAALAGVFVLVSLAWDFGFVRSPWPLWSVGAVMALLNLNFFGLHRAYPERSLRALSAEALLQIAMDVVGLGLLTYFSGGLANPFVFFFTHHVVISSVLLDRRQAYRVAILTTAVVAFLALAEQAESLGPWPLRGALAAPPATPLARGGLVFALGTTLIFSAYVGSSIMERLRTHSRDVRRLNADLAERLALLASADRKLAAEHDRARAILECMDEGVVVVDLKGKVILANTAGLQRLQVALEDTFQRAGVLAEPPAAPTAAGEAVPRSHAAAPLSTGAACSESEHADPASPKAACLTDALAHGGRLSADALALLSADPPRSELPPKLRVPAAPVLVDVERQGRRFENTVSAVRTAPGETLGLLVVSRDVTERRSLERQVLHAEKLHAAGSLAAGVAHELNTPLGTILGYAQMLLEDTRGLASSRTERDLQAIEEQARRCRRIVQGLLEFSRKSRGEREPVRPPDLLAKIAALTAHSLELRGLALEVLPPPSVLPPVEAVAHEIEQVLVNLVTNAADAIETLPQPPPQGGRVALSSSYDPISRLLILAVEDNGPGVPEELRQLLFEPFFTTKAAGKGTGLGLPIARRIAEDHGGTLVLLSRKDGNHGSRFELRIPLVEVGARNGKNYTPSPQIALGA